MIDDSHKAEEKIGGGKTLDQPAGLTGTLASNGTKVKSERGALAIATLSVVAAGAAVLPLIRVRGVMAATDCEDAGGVTQQLGDPADCADCAAIMSPADCTPADNPDWRDQADNGGDAGDAGDGFGDGCGCGACGDGGDPGGDGEIEELAS
jgi:hypothetical protein